MQTRFCKRRTDPQDESHKIAPMAQYHCLTALMLHHMLTALTALQPTWAIVIQLTNRACGAIVRLVVAGGAVSAQVIVFHNAADGLAPSVVWNGKVTRQQIVGGAGDIIALDDRASHS
jgi:hypothetical protein